MSNSENDEKPKEGGIWRVIVIAFMSTIAHITLSGLIIWGLWGMVIPHIFPAGGVSHTISFSTAWRLALILRSVYLLSK